MEEKKCNAYKKGKCLLTLDCANGNNVIESIRDRLCKNNPNCPIKQLQLKEKMIGKLTQKLEKVKELLTKSVYLECDICPKTPHKDYGCSAGDCIEIADDFIEQALAELEE
jgi:hypothetical protein